MEEDAELFEARWKGTTSLDAEALGATQLDGLVFAVVAFRVEEMGATKLTKGGLRRRKDIFNVEDARVMLGGLRDEAVQFIAGRELEMPDEVVNNITELKQLPQVEVPDDEDDQTTVVARVDDYKSASLEQPPAGGDGPKVAKFQPTNDIEVMETDHEVIGSIHGDGYQGKDKILKKFMEN